MAPAHFSLSESLPLPVLFRLKCVGSRCTPKLEGWSKVGQECGCGFYLPSCSAPELLQSGYASPITQEKWQSFKVPQGWMIHASPLCLQPHLLQALEPPSGSWDMWRGLHLWNFSLMVASAWKSFPYISFPCIIFLNRTYHLTIWLLYMQHILYKYIYRKC